MALARTALVKPRELVGSCLMERASYEMRAMNANIVLPEKSCHPSAMSLTRRSFIRRTALASIAFPAVVRSVNANSKLQVAVVGANGQGMSDLSEIGSHTSVQFV